MLKVRVIPTLLYREFGLVKGVRFETRRQIGAPMQAIKVYELRGVDELVFLDVVATTEERGPDAALIDDLADDCFMPFTVGGGVRNAADVRRLLEVGADKVSVNTALVENPAAVEEAAGRFGSQCIVASVDTMRDDAGSTTVWVRSASRPTGRDPVEVARHAESLGAGEILLTSIDRDGTMDGYDIETLRAVVDAVSIPVIASGGAGSYEHMAEAIEAGGASAVAAASIFHFTQLTPLGAKEHLRSRGVPVRL